MDTPKTRIFALAKSLDLSEGYGMLLYLTALLEFDPSTLVPQSEEERMDRRIAGWTLPTGPGAVVSAVSLDGTPREVGRDQLRQRKNEARSTIATRPRVGGS